MDTKQLDDFIKNVVYKMEAASGKDPNPANVSDLEVTDKNGNIHWLLAYGCMQNDVSTVANGDERMDTYQITTFMDIMDSYYGIKPGQHRNKNELDIINAAVNDQKLTPEQFEIVQKAVAANLPLVVKADAKSLDIVIRIIGDSH